MQCEDYLGIQLVKKLKLLDAKKQAAEVAVHFGRFDDAEKLYRQMDRRDLALELRVRLGEWTKVVQLVQQGGGDDNMLQMAWNKVRGRANPSPNPNPNPNPNSNPNPNPTP